MDTMALSLFLAAAFFGGLTSGLSGFAMGLVVSGVWLHIIAPDQNALLIVLCGLVTQGAGIWRVRHAIRWRAVMPLILGSAIGVAGGAALLATANQGSIRLGIGVLLLLYSAYSLARPAIEVPEGGVAAHAGVGVVNGLIGGLTGLGGIAVSIWGQLRGGSKDAQRAVFQPVMFATFFMTAISLAFVGAYTAETMRLYAFALPALIVGIGCGIWLYGKLDDAAFRRVILVLLFASGLSLVVPAAVRSASALPLCKPVLGFTQARFSAMLPPTMEHTWTAVVSADASACATSSGAFEILIARQMENGPEADFIERFTWTPGTFEISVNFWADEAVEGYWINGVDACPCRR